MIKSRAKVLAANQPMAHQRISLAHDAKNPVVFDTSDPGTGKTAVRVWAFAARRRKGGGKALVLAPRTLLRTTWAHDFLKFAPDMKVSVALATNRDKAFADNAADVYITNHDASKWLAKKPKTFWAQFSELIMDEPTAYKHYSSQRSRAMLKISKHFKYRSGLTATPNSNGICDIWHPTLLLDGGTRLGTSYFAFRSATCVPIQVGRSAQMIEWRDKDGAEEAVFGTIADIVIRHKFEDCVDIPPTHHYQVSFELPLKQRRVYDTMEAAQLLVLKTHAATNTLTAVNAAAVATKLLQICSGAVYDNDGRYHVLDTERYELITDMVEARKRSLVFFTWKHQKEQLTALAETRGLSYCVLDGDATDQERADRINGYQRGLYKVIYAHPQTAAHGVTLTAGQSTIWAGPTYNLEWFKQGSKRQARIGQTEKTEVVMVLAKDTIEEKVYEILMGKNLHMTNLLDLFASMTPSTPGTKKLLVAA